MKSINFLKEKKISQLFSINLIIAIILVIVLIMTFVNNEILSYGIDFDSLYSEVEKLSYETPKKINTNIDNISFYLPQGYTASYDEGIFLESIYGHLDVIPNKLNMNNIGSKYEINPNEEIVYEKINSNDGAKKYTNMLVWKMGNDMYEILLLNENNDAIVGDIKSKYLYQGVTDMAYILNSIKDI